MHNTLQLQTAQTIVSYIHPQQHVILPEPPLVRQFLRHKNSYSQVRHRQFLPELSLDQLK